MPYPDGADLADFLLARELITDLPSDFSDLDDLMAALARQWQKETGWSPFLATGAPSERKFTLNWSELLFLNAGIVSTTGLVVSLNGSELTLDTDFWLRPGDAPGREWPWTQIEFRSAQDTLPDAITVTADWGFCSAIPDEVFRALLRKGAAEWLRDFANTSVGTGGALVSMRQDDVSKTWAASVNKANVDEYGGSLQQQFGAAYDRIKVLYGAPWLVMM